MDINKLFEVCYDNTRMASVNGATNYIRYMIILQRYPAGMQLTELQLAEECGTSRGSIRTALQELEKEGLIRSLSNGRKQVVGFSQKYVADLYEMRRILETTALRTILNTDEAERQGEAELLSTALLCAGGVANGTVLSPTERVRMDAEFHRTLVKSAGSQALLQCWLTIEPVIWALLNVNATISDPERHMMQFDKHKDLVKQLLANDERVVEDLEEHIRESHRLVKEVLEKLDCQ